MNAAQGFLAVLADLALYDDVELTVSRQKGGRLNVTIRRTGEDPMIAVGRADVLETSLPAEIGKYARWLEQQHGIDEVEIKLPGAMARKAAATPRRPTPAKAPAAKKKPAPKKAAPAKLGQPGKAECIADYRALKAKHGAKLTRNLFVRVAKTGRRYESLWANCWPDFVKEAERGMPAATPPAAKKPATPKPKAAAPAPAPKKPATPAPATPKDDNRPKPWRVLDKGGKELGVTVLEKKVGDTYNCAAGTFEVVAVNAEKREVRVEAKRATETPPATAKPAEPKAALYVVLDSAGNKLGATLDPYKVGDPWGTGDRYEIERIDHEKHEYIVRGREATKAAAATTVEGA